MTQITIPALYMRGGTSKGVFFDARQLPVDAAERDAVLLRVIGSPDPYGKHTDGMGGATSSTSKVVLLTPSSRPDCDVDYLFGQVAIDQALIDWSGNCGNLSAAVGPYALHRGWVKAQEGSTEVRIWQANIEKRIRAIVPTSHGSVIETGSYVEDGVAFPGGEIRLEFLDPAEAGESGLLPTGRPTDDLDVPGIGRLRVSLINAGNPTVFVRADALGLNGTEMPNPVNQDAALLARLEAIRAHAAVAMGLAPSAEWATLHRPGTPKVSFVAAPADYTSSAGTPVAATAVDVVARIVSMGKLHHAFTGTGSIALAVAAALPGSIVANISHPSPGIPTRIGHVSGVLPVGAILEHTHAGWRVERAILSRTARRLMEGAVFVPALST